MFPEKEIREWAAASGISYKEALREIARFYEEDFGRKEPKPPIMQVEGYVMGGFPEHGGDWYNIAESPDIDLLDVAKDRGFVHDKKVRVTIEEIND